MTPQRFLTLVVIAGALVAAALLLASYVTTSRPTSLLAASVIFMMLLVAVVRLADRTVSRQVRISLIGAPGVGKTVFVTSLFDSLQTAVRAPLRFAPASETVDRVLNTIGGYARGQWAARTPSDYLYLYVARLAPARRSLRLLLGEPREYELQVADAAGEQLSEFVPGESRWNAKTSYYQYAVDSHVLFFFIDYPTLAASRPQPLADRTLTDQVNDLIFVIQDVCEANNVGPSRRLETPIAIILTKCDLAVGRDESPEELIARASELHRLLAVAESRCRWVKIFPVSATGPLSDPTRPPSALHPINIDIPLFWALNARFRFGVDISDRFSSDVLVDIDRSTP